MTDLTRVQTIYTRRIRTVAIKIDPTVVRETGQTSVTTSGAAHAVARIIFDRLDDHQEHLVVLVLNASNIVTGFKVISSGGMSEATADPKLVFRAALLLGARNLILVHNHPSNNLEPSREDWALTSSIVQAGKMLALPLLDHLILSSTDYVSLRELRPSVFT